MSRLDNDLDRVLRAVRARWRGVRLVEGALVAIAPLAAATLALVVLDNVLHLPHALRWAGAAAFVAAVVWLVWARVRPAALFAPTDDDAAVLVERRDPSLDNVLINAVQLGREDLTGFRGVVARQIAEDAAASVASVPLAGVVPLTALRRAAVAALVAVTLVGAYAAAFPERFANAVERFARPAAAVAPITATRLAVTPGSTTVLEGSAVVVRAVATGDVPATATLTVHGADGTAEFDMPFAGDAFAFELKDLRTAISYSVAAGDATSETFRVDVVAKPRIERMAVELRWPEYLGREPRRDDPAEGSVAAPKGTGVTVVATTSRPVAEARAVFDRQGPVPATVEGRTVTFAFTVGSDDRWRLDLRDAAGFRDPDPPTFTVTAVPDAPPVVAFREPAGNVSVAADAEVTVAVEAKDDFGLAEVTLRAARGRDERLLDTWPAAGRLATRSVRLVRIADLGAQAGESVTLVAAAKDLAGHATQARPLVVTVVTGRQDADRLGRELASIVARLRRVLEKQQAARADAGRGRGVVAQQTEILGLTSGVLADWTDPKLLRLGARAKVQGLVVKEMPAAVRQTGEALTATQDEILRVLVEVLAELDRLVAASKSGDLDRALQAGVAVDPSAAVKDLLRGLREFVDQQKDVIALSQDLAGIVPEDLTDEQRKDLEALAATEEKWGKYLREKVTDLSKLPPQDFSNGDVLKELIEARSDVELAADALSGKKVEIAVPLEESGLELAKSLTANIERWLADVPDQIKWEMEEPASQPEVPMADLPEELEDLIGDLIDREEAMTDETEDVTSSWMDSINEGAGWTAMDGPISNMSAKGITGNLQPNSQEVGGRSGEGRSGKSSGQMVEESATGKGGRQTPTRVTPDPYEKGQVKDTSTDPTGGSTGGGKESGGNREGLRGSPPPETQRRMERLANQQAVVRNTAEKVDAALERRSVHATDLRKAIERMRFFEDQLRKGRGGDYTALQREVVEHLAATRKVAGDLLATDRDPTHGLPRELRDQVLNALDEPMPKEYEDAIRAYYKSLSEGR